MRFLHALSLTVLIIMSGFLFGCNNFNGVAIDCQHLDVNDYNLKHKIVGDFEEVRYITIHNTWNSASAQRERDYLNDRRDNISVSFHYVVDESGAIQIIPDDQRAWHAGDGRNGGGNRYSIGIEIARSRCYGAEEPLYRQAEENGVRLAAWLLYKHNLNVNCLRMHKDWSGKICPHRILEENRWPDFKERVAFSLNQLIIKNGK